MSDLENQDWGVKKLFCGQCICPCFIDIANEIGHLGHTVLHISKIEEVIAVQKLPVASTWLYIAFITF